MPAANVAPIVPAFDATMCRDFLRYTLDPAIGSMEVRAFRAKVDRGNMIRHNDEYNTTLAAWYDDPDHIIADARKFSGVSAYVTVNPVKSDLLARSRRPENRNAPVLARCKNMTTDGDVACIRWAYIDIDPVRPADISSTDEELAAAVDVRDRILADEPGMRDAGMWGKSGNGAWILVGLDNWANEPETPDMIRKVLWITARRYNTDCAKIDTKTYNPSRVMCLPGTAKCKGANTADRPWRLVTLDGIGEGLR